MHISRRQVIQSTGQFLITFIGGFVAQLTVLATTTNRFPTGFEIYVSFLIAFGLAIPIAAAIFGMSKIKTETVLGPS
jgi:glycerol uptake facilitator-like aquaporin